MLFRKRLSKGKNRLLIKEGLVTCPVSLYLGSWESLSITAVLVAYDELLIRMH